MKLSAVIATYNRREPLADCLTTLLDQDLPAGQCEIVVVVDGSSDGTSEMLNAFRPQCELVVVQQENQGQTAALNAGVAAATGEIVLFLDDDLLCDRGLLSAHLAAHERGGPKLVFGRMRSVSGRSPSLGDRVMQENLEKYYSRLEKDPLPRWPDDAWAGPNCSMPRAVFLATGGYDEKLFPRRGEDVDLGLRLWKMGIQFRFEPKAVTSHRWVKSDRRYWADAEEDGASIIRLYRKHPGMRSHSWLVGAMNAPAWKRYVATAASSRSVVARLLLGTLVSLCEKLVWLTWTQRIGMRLFVACMGVAAVTGARREVGSWRLLKNLFGSRMAVLLYHHIGFPTPETENLSLTVTPQKFERQVRWLHWRGYTAITPAQWLTWCIGGESLPEKPILLTFDDAYADITEHALPVLERYGFRSAVFVISGKVGGVNTWDGLPVMTMEQIRHWAARGVEIGAHSRTHPYLTAVPDDVLPDEVAGSKEDLMGAGLVPLSFAYPYGSLDDRVRKSVDGVFPLAFTCEEGLNDLRTDPLLLRRTMVQPGDTIFDIELRARLGWSPLNSVRSRPTITIAVSESVAAHEAPSTVMSAAILHLLGTAQPEGIGIARIVAALAAGLDPAKYHVHAWFLGPSGPLLEDLQAAGASARSIEWWRGIRDPVGACRFWRCLRNYDFAIVHQHFGARSVRQLISLSSNARLVVHLHGRVSEPGSPNSVAIAVRGADLVIAASRAVALEIPNLNPIVVHAGVESRMEFCAEDTTPRSATVIGAACRLVPLKGLVDLIRAAALLCREFPTLRLEIAGAGSQREDLEREVVRLGLTGRVRFLGWQRDLGPIFRSWDIFAMPSLEEGFGVAALEAMAEGLPVVATSVGGLPEVVVDGETGYLVPPSDVTALSGRLRLLMLDPKRRRAMGAAGRERARNHFSLDRMVAEITAIYDSLVPDPQ